MAVNIPPGFEVKPDGTIGPVGPNPVGSDWNAPYRQQPVPPGGTPNVGGTPTGALAPAVDLAPSPLGTSLTSTPPDTGASGPGFGVPHVDPATGQPEMLTGPGSIVDRNTRGAFNPFGFVGRGNPYWRGAIAAGGALTPTPTASDTAPTNAWFQRPSGVGGAPGPQVTNPPQPAHPSTMRYPMWPTPPVPAAASSIPIGGGPGNVMEAPTGTPSATPRRINPKSVNLGTGTPGVTAPVAAPANSPFIGIDRPNSGPNERNRGSPQATALDLSALFSHPAVAAAAAAHPAVRAAGRAISPTTGQPMPMSSADAAYGLPDARGAPYPYAIGDPDRAAKIANAAKRSGYQ
jgi:hypothetical protein